MTNRLAVAADMRPNRDYHYMVRQRTDAKDKLPRSTPSEAAGKNSAAARRGQGKAR